MPSQPRCTEDVLETLRGRVALVGNATPRHALGALIDRYDHVIRMNNFRLAGFERLVGTRTDLRCTSGWKDVEHRNAHLELSPFTAESSESANLADWNRANARPLLTPRTDIHPLVPAVPRPSTGCAMTALCSHVGLELDLFGFDGFQSAHYWSQERLETVHSGRELDVMLGLPGVLLLGDTYDYQRVYDYCFTQHPAYENNCGLELVTHLERAFRGLKILEYGAGNGDLSHHLAAQGNDVLALEAAAPSFARIRCRKIHGTALALAALDETFDLFVSVDVLEHLTENDIRLVIREAARRCEKIFVSVSTRPSGLLGPDGENLHLTVRPPTWWREQFGRHFDVRLAAGNYPDQWVLEGGRKARVPELRHAARAAAPAPAPAAAAQVAAPQDGPAVSVVVPCPDGAELLPFTVSSIALQSWKDWEVVVVDDGVNDRVAQVARALAEKLGEGRLRLVRQPRAGAAAARDAGFRAARGACVVAVSPGDALDAEHLSSALAALRNRPEAGAVVTGAIRFSGLGEEASQAADENLGAAAALYRREAALAAARPGDPALDDRALWARVTERVLPVRLDEPLVYRRATATAPAAAPAPAAPAATPYDGEFYDAQVDGSLGSARRIVPLVLSLVDARSVLDLGCGLGTFLRAFQERGVADVLGLDGEHVPVRRLLVEPQRFRAADLSQGVDAGRRFDLAMSLEVAEHLPVERANRFVSDLCRHAHVVLFSAAVPGQGGTHHVNEQWPSFWIPRFRAHGFEPLDLLRPALWQDEQVEWWYRQNCLLFADAEGLRANPRLGAALAAAGAGTGTGDFKALDLVHPRAFEWKVSTLATLEAAGRRVA